MARVTGTVEKISLSQTTETALKKQEVSIMLGQITLVDGARVLLKADNLINMEEGDTVTFFGRKKSDGFVAEGYVNETQKVYGGRNQTAKLNFVAAIVMVVFSVLLIMGLITAIFAIFTGFTALKLWADSIREGRFYRQAKGYYNSLSSKHSKEQLATG